MKYKTFLTRFIFAINDRPSVNIWFGEHFNGINTETGLKILVYTLTAIFHFCTHTFKYGSLPL